MDDVVENLNRQFCELGSIMPWNASKKTKQRPAFKVDPPHASTAIFCPEIATSSIGFARAPSDHAPTGFDMPPPRPYCRINFNEVDSPAKSGVSPSLARSSEDMPSPIHLHPESGARKIALDGHGPHGTDYSRTTQKRSTDSSPQRGTDSHQKKSGDVHLGDEGPKHKLSGPLVRPAQVQTLTGVPSDIFASIKDSDNQKLVTTSIYKRLTSDEATMVVDASIDRQLAYEKLVQGGDMAHRKSRSLDMSQLMEQIHKREIASAAKDSQMYLEFVKDSRSIMANARLSLGFDPDDVQAASGSNTDRRLVSEMKVRLGTLGEERARLYKMAEMINKKNMRNVKSSSDVTVKRSNGVCVHGPERLPTWAARENLEMESINPFLSRLGKIPGIHLYK